MSDPLHAAPHDGTPIDVLVDGEWVTAQWSKVGERWMTQTRLHWFAVNPTGWRYPGTDFDRGRERYYRAYCRRDDCGSPITGRALDGKFLGWWHSMDVIDDDHEAVGHEGDIERWSEEAHLATREKLTRDAEQPRVQTREEKLQTAVDAVLAVHYEGTVQNRGYCIECASDRDIWATYPCTTVKAIQEALR